MSFSVHRIDRALTLRLEKGEAENPPYVLDWQPDDVSIHIEAAEGACGCVAIVCADLLPSGITIHAEVEHSAQLTIVTLLTTGATDCSVQQTGSVSREGRLSWHNITLSHGVTQDLRSTVMGDGGRSDIDWIFFATGHGVQTLSVRNVFEGRQGTGEIVMKGVAQHKAHVSASGMIDIGLGAGGTNTYLTQNVLMLDSSARVDAIPALEIKTNDVKASHSATISRVSEEDLFYFASRGIRADDARQMYVEGFLSELTVKIGDGELRQRVKESIGRKLREEK